MKPETPEEIEAAISGAVPTGWYAGNLLTRVALDDRDPTVTYSVEFVWGTTIEGGRTMHYAGKTDTQQSARRLTVTADGASSADWTS